MVTILQEAFYGGLFVGVIISIVFHTFIRLMKEIVIEKRQQKST